MDAPFAKTVRDGLTQYFKANWGTSTTKGCDWEAMKFEIRGLCVQTTYGVKCQLKKDVLNHEARLSDLEKCLLKQPQKMEDWQQARRVLLEDWRRLKIYVYKAYRQRLHAEGNKAGALLARLLKQHADHTPVTALVDGTGRSICMQVAINTVFRDHLGRLYALPGDGPPEVGTTFLNGVTLPQLTQDTKALLKDPIDWGEIQ
ncbi:hypothetical protein NDU88_005395 [Pleurodeles waltl]|uniref:Uncharacterized protein n=1 Tax=Pleurodeles waltl TaxID=8319 RepID=A0AAV7SLH5_PLEWA|nr:hypothetical protein NDU88_005395 [Pleurodeles waltl]